jgi:hypothetical protein
MPPPLPALAPAAPRRKNATTARTIPGTAERCSGLGGAGRPARADTIEIRFMARAGLDEAKNAAATARRTATMMTTHGN